MQISKSDYMLFLKHPAWLWLKKHDPKKLPPVDDATQAIFDTGHAFEQYAESLFSGCVTLGFNNYDEYISLPKRTSEALDSDAKTIFQGRFEYEQLTFICDIIQVVGDKTVDLIEIKSSTKVKPEHEFDLAFQMVVLEGCGFTVRNISVVHVNNQYIRQGEIDAKKITSTTDITNAVKAKREITKKYIAEALKIANSDTIPDISPSHARLGSFPEWLGIYRSLSNIEPDSIYDICSIGAKNVGILEGLGITKMIDIPDNFKLNAKQSLQLKATRLGKPIIERDKIKEFLDSLVFPLYFFDYETMMSLVPYFDGMGPYKQYPFQYSLHILDSPDAELRHVGYLHKDNSNPVEELSGVLQTQIGDSGSVITWNMSFEKSCNDLIGAMLPEYADFYEKLNERIVDLMIPFSNGWYADKNFQGSASIKNVLPVLVPELSYKTLGIQEGTAAQRSWMDAVLNGDDPKNEKEKVLSDLTEYCGLDTLAMVEIYRKLKSL